jgi:integrase
MPRLSKRIVDSAEKKDKDYFIWDSDVRGFGLRVLTSGKKSYMIQYRAGGRTRRYTFSPHGTMTPDEAKKKAKELLVQVVKGGNPSEDKRRYSEAPKMKNICKRFLDEYVKKRCKKKTYDDYQSLIDRFIKPSLGNYRTLDITRKDVAKLHKKLGDRPYQANRTLAVLSKIFNLTEEWGLRPDGSNPCRHVKKYKEAKRERYLSPDELKELGKTLREAAEDKTETAHVVAAFQLLILTGCRLMEIQTLKWSYVQENALLLPDSKTGAKKVYLGSAAREVLDAIARDPENEYVITGEKKGRHVTDLQKPWQRIREAAGLNDVRIHDLRHSFASGAVGMGESLPMIGRLLGHTQAQTTARYAHLADEPMHNAADRVSDKIAETLNAK